LEQVRGEDAESVAALLRYGPVGIDDREANGLGVRPGEQYTVRARAAVSVAEADGEVARDVGNGAGRRGRAGRCRSNGGGHCRGGSGYERAACQVRCIYDEVVVP